MTNLTAANPEGTTMNAEHLRLEALRFAIDPTITTEEVIARAQTYYAFLTADAS